MVKNRYHMSDKRKQRLNVYHKNYREAKAEVTNP